jgi:hypothetical protein
LVQKCQWPFGDSFFVSLLFFSYVFTIEGAIFYREKKNLVMRCLSNVKGSDVRWYAIFSLIYFSPLAQVTAKRSSTLAYILVPHINKILLRQRTERQLWKKVTAFLVRKVAFSFFFDLVRSEWGRWPWS